MLNHTKGQGGIGTYREKGSARLTILVETGYKGGMVELAQEDREVVKVNIERPGHEENKSMLLTIREVQNYGELMLIENTKNCDNMGDKGTKGLVRIEGREGGLTENNPRGRIPLQECTNRLRIKGWCRD